MSGVSTAGGAASAASATNAQSSKAKPNDFRDLDLGDFLKLLISELQNQDPMNPMDNSQMVQQLSTIRGIGATNQLTETLGGFAVTQQLTTASSLIGQTVNGLSDSGKEVSGKVESVVVETDSKDSSSRKIKVRVAGETMEVQNVRQINAEAAAVKT